MLRHPRLLLAVAFSLYTTSLALRCFPGRVPQLDHCVTLVGAISYISQLPMQDEPKEWGRTIETGPYAQKVPMSYLIEGPEQNTCAVYVDVNAEDYYAIDTFKVLDVAVAAHAVVTSCVGLGQIGLARPAGVQHVFAKVMRSDGRRLLDGPNVEIVTLPNSTDRLIAIGAVPSTSRALYDVSTS